MVILLILKLAYSGYEMMFKIVRVMSNWKMSWKQNGVRKNQKITMDNSLWNVIDKIVCLIV